MAARSDSALTIGQMYTRSEIHDLLGGGVQEYLPSVRRRIVCGCFVPRMNPDAPDVIFAGTGPRIQESARWLCGQVGPIPVFLKWAVNAWQYVGEYAVRDWTEDREVIAVQKRKSGRDDITRVIYLRAIA